MMIRRWAKTLAATALLVGVLAGLFLAVDFRAAQSNTSTQHSISRYTLGLAQEAKAPLPASMALHVPADGPLADSLRKRLALSLGKLGLSKVTLLDALPEDTSQPVLIVQVDDANVNWTPVYARAALDVSLVYASDGDMSWRDEFTVRMESRDGGPQIRIRGTLGIVDSTSGIVSEPAYRGHLVERVAGYVSAALREQLPG